MLNNRSTKDKQEIFATFISLTPSIQGHCLVRKQWFFYGEGEGANDYYYYYYYCCYYYCCYYCYFYYYYIKTAAHLGKSPKRHVFFRKMP